MPLIGRFPIEVRTGYRSAQDPGYLDVDVRNLELAFRNENLLHLSTFLQADMPIANGGPIDEAIMKLRIRVTDSTILLTYPDALEPVRLRVDSVWVLRSKDGTYQILVPFWTLSRLFSELQMKETKEERERRRIDELERENAELRRKLNEAKALVQRLAKENFNVAL